MQCADGPAGRHVHGGEQAGDTVAESLGLTITYVHSERAIDIRVTIADAAERRHGHTNRADAGAARWVEVSLTETAEENYRQEKRSRPGADTRYRRITTTRYSVAWHTRDEQIAYDAASDGCFPLITNDRHLTDAELLVAYRYQPNLERRHHLLKSVQDAAPVWLRDPARIEAIFCCQFLALLVAALIERQIRTTMRDANTAGFPLYPELRDCPAPSAERIFNVFADLTRHELHCDGELVQTFEADLNPLQQQILDLLGVPESAYQPS